MDLIKEYDDKRLQMIESYAVSKRNESESLKLAPKERYGSCSIKVNNINSNSGATSSKLGGGKESNSKHVPKGDYYKDQGRKPYKIP